MVNTTEETAPPVTPVGTREVAFLIGPEPRQTIAIGSLSTGRITRRINFGKGPVTSLAATPDGTTLYCAAAGTIWTLPAAGGEAKKLRAGDSVSIDPAGRELLIKLNEKERFRLVMIPRNGGPEREIRMSGDLRLTPSRSVPMPSTRVAGSSCRWSPPIPGSGMRAGSTRKAESSAVFRSTTWRTITISPGRPTVV